MSFLAIDYPSPVYGGVPRLNLGLIEMLGTICIFVMLHIISRKTKKEGFVMNSLLLSYSVFRFFLDFYRATDLINSDARYLLLTPAQWGCIAVLLLVTYNFIVIARKKICLHENLYTQAS